jgi:hypothetical protein
LKQVERPCFAEEKLMEALIPGIRESTLEAIVPHSVAGNLQWLDAPSMVAAMGERGRTARTAETVMTTLIVCTASVADERPFAIPTSYSCLSFRVPCRAQQVYLLIGSEDGRAIALQEMEKDEESQWHIILRLEAGAYRYGYYANHGVAKTQALADEWNDAPIRMDDFASFAFSRIATGNQTVRGSLSDKPRGAQTGEQS